MPEKKKKAKKGKKGSIADVSILKKFLKTYENHCTKEKSAVSLTIKKGLRRCIENEVNITKFVLANPEISLEDAPPEFLNPLLMTIRDERYMLGKELFVWGIQLRNQDIANLAILLGLRGRTVYPFSKLELLDCGIDTWSLERLGKVINFSNLVSLVLDYNEFGEDGLRSLVYGLQGNKKLLSLSLCYCNLGPPAGAMLGPVLAETAIQEIYLNGNYLQCTGALELITQIAGYAQKLGSERQASTIESRKDIARQILEADQSAGVNTAISEEDNTVPDPPPPGKPDSIARRRKKKKEIKKKTKEPVEVGAWITKLHLADNGIDGRGEEGEIGVLGFIQILSFLIMYSETLKELDLDDNSIGDLPAHDILEALVERKQGNLDSLKIKVTGQMSPDTFHAIFKHSKKLKSTKKRKKKKAKK
ncbi:hypothetical protein NDU88_003692 [Pleurodeles waltl]|uniref:Uncharacterized protein n=1 Tax=Pleurodeles waltl TaxID=8319 RepID=A0AAV7LHS2_PLEWA|nr:hypothetical protein NDU88_003692 [Pleurodeles waltl]